MNEIALIVSLVLALLAVQNGFGKHLYDVEHGAGHLLEALKVWMLAGTVTHVTNVLQYWWVFQSTYKVVIGFNKLAFLLLYHRVFVTRWFQRLCKITILVVVLGTLSFVLATIFQCLPIAASWDKHVRGRCINNSPFRWSWAGYNLATELLIVFMPAKVIWGLNMDRIKKIGLVVLFMVGLFICAASALRIRALVESVKQTDTTWTSEPALLWSVVEAAVGLFCANIPFLRRPISQILPKSWTGSSSPGWTSSHSWGRWPGWRLKKGYKWHEPRTPLPTKPLGVSTEDIPMVPPSGVIHIRRDIDMEVEEQLEDAVNNRGDDDGIRPVHN